MSTKDTCFVYKRECDYEVVLVNLDNLSVSSPRRGMCELCASEYQDYIDNLEITNRVTITIRQYEDGSVDIYDHGKEDFIHGLVLDAIAEALLFSPKIATAQHVRMFYTALGYLGDSEHDDENTDDSGRDEVNGGWVYVLEGIGTYWYKIGMTTKAPDYRVGQYSPKLPFETRIHHAFEADKPLEAEHKLHALFENKRDNGEWFALSADDIRYLSSIKSYDNGEFITGGKHATTD